MYFNTQGHIDNH